MNPKVNFSEFGKNYYLRHIRLIREFSLQANEALLQNDPKSCSFYLTRAHRIVKGINPFGKYLTESDRVGLSFAQNRLKKLFAKIPSQIDSMEIDTTRNLIEEIIVETVDLEKDVLGISFAQLTQKVLIENNHNPRRV
ncbi:MAG: hypothetical protein ABIK93_05830 [candidate division WOR-3 bacterium]